MGYLTDWYQFNPIFNGLTDKENGHNYITSFYDHLLSKYQDKSIDILQIGVYNGGSIVMWSQMFPLGTVVGVDNVDSTYDFVPLDGTNYSIVIQDAYDTTSVQDIKKTGPFDLIIDDGPHTYDSQLFVLQNYSTMLKPGGIIVIEDIQSIDNAKKLVAAVPGAELVDLRSVNNVYDNIIIKLIKQ